MASLISALFFGLLPALEATRLTVVDAIRGNFAARPPSRSRAVLVIGQIAGSALLLTLAGVLLREAARLQRMDTGLRTHDVASIEVANERRQAVLDALGEVRWIDAIGASAALPLDMRFPVTTVAGADSTRLTIAYNRVSSSYFTLLGIGIVAGRTFTPEEERAASGVVIVSEAAARALWPGESPIGRVVHQELDTRRDDPAARYQNAQVIGIARDVVVQTLEEGRDRPVLYFPQSVTMPGCCILARIRGNPVETKRSLDVALEKQVPGGVDRIDLLDTFVAGSLYAYRVAYWVALVLGSLALGLTVIGVFGVVGYVVRQRAREIGVRVALGATQRDVVGLIMCQSLRQACVGGAIGATLALGAASILAANIQQMPRFDIIAFAAAFLVVAGACLLAAFLPSRRAARVDPTIVLRQE
jgi:hypothetical protein